VPRLFVHSFGCRASQADGAAIESGLEARGWDASQSAADAELVILNTCTVTSAADEDLRHAVRRIHRDNPGARIVVTGCYAQRAPSEIASLPGVDLVVGNSHKTRIPDLVVGDENGTPYHGQIHVGDIFDQHKFLSAPVVDSYADRTRPNLKIQDGCNNRCSFCIIPFVRGRSRSAPADQVVDEVRKLAAKYREVVFSGINLGRWGREQGFSDEPVRLAHLLRRILDETPVEMLRLSSVEPMDWSDDLLDLVASSPRIAKHVHAPLQSGSDAVLRRMHRKYRPRHYEDRIRKARAAMPDAAIGADVMTGFPGETDAEFEESRDFIESLPFTYLHVFTYSERPGTPAASGPQVPIRVRRDRNRIIREIGAAKNQAFRESMAGRTLTAVTIDGGRSALSSNYLKVELASQREENRLIQVIIGGIGPGTVRERSLLCVLV
jgi:threonylcarbamoyladenosine tRNA methylthiotransferase MtaB